MTSRFGTIAGFLSLDYRYSSKHAIHGREVISGCLSGDPESGDMNKTVGTNRSSVFAGESIV